MSLIIREAGIEDAGLIADISQSTFYDAFASQNTEADMNKFLNEQFTKGKLMLEVGNSENTFLMAWIDKDLVGYAKLRDGKKPYLIQNKNALEIARLYVIKNKIGMGIGKALMQSCIDIAKEKNMELTWLGVWEKNHQAIRFYINWGFEKFGETDFLLGDDMQNDWLMKKEIK